MRVVELMCSDVRTCFPWQSLADCARIMWDADCGCVPVVEANHRVCGIVTDRDICMATYLVGRTQQEMPVESVMARPVVVCAPDELVSEAEARMAQAQVRRLPVVTALGRLVGILSLNDIAVEAERNRLIRVTDVGLDEVGLTLGLVSHHRLVQ